MDALTALAAVTSTADYAAGSQSTSRNDAALSGKDAGDDSVTTSSGALASSSSLNSTVRNEASKPASASDLQAALSRLQKQASVTAPNLQFSVDKSTGTMVIKVTDKETKEVIRQIPPEVMLQIERTFAQLSESKDQGGKTGVLFNSQA